MNYSLNFYLDRPDEEIKSTELKSIYYYITWDGDRIRKSTKKKCRQCDWVDQEEKRGKLTKIQRINSKLEYSLQINSYLSDIEYRVSKYFEQCEKENVQPGRDEVEEVASGNVKIGEDKEFKALLDKFIEDSETGARKTKKGKKIKKPTLKNYKQARSILENFEEKKRYKLVWKNINDTFYTKFTNYMWEDLNYYDNAVGSIIKVVKAFIDWCDAEKLIKQNPLNKTWIVWEEEIDIIVLYPDELNILFNAEPPTDRLKRAKDIFLAGCMTCLRVSNVLGLNKEDLQGTKLKIISVKGDKPITIDCPPMLLQIFSRYENLLPSLSEQQFNLALKDLAKWFAQYIKDNKNKLKVNFIGNDWTKDMVKTRYKRGEPIKTKVPITDTITSHTMRRTGITNLLMMGLTEIEVKAISGHTFGSKHFSKYVKIAEQFISKKSTEAWGKIAAN